MRRSGRPSMRVLGLWFALAMLCATACLANAAPDEKDLLTQEERSGIVAHDGRIRSAPPPPAALFWRDWRFYGALGIALLMAWAGPLVWTRTLRRMVSKRTDELRKSEERFRTAFESASDCILIWDKEYNYLYANQSAIDHVGSTRDRVVGKNIRDGLGHIPDFMHLWMSRVDKVFATKEVLHVQDESIINKEQVYTDSIISPLLSTDGTVLAVCVVYRNITELKRAEEELRREKEFTETALNTLSDIFLVFDPTTGKPILWNHAFSEVSGYTDEEIKSMKAPDAWCAGEDLEAVAANSEKILKTGHGMMQLSLITKSGQRVLIEYSTSLIKDDHGAAKYIISVGRDITKRKQAEEKLQQSEESHRALLNSLSSGIVVHATDTSILYANSTACKLLGLSEEQLMGRESTDPQWKFLNDDKSDMILEDYPVNRIISTNKPLHNLVVGVVRPHIGDIAWLLTNGYSGHDDPGQNKEIIITFTDITERKLAEEGLVASLKESERLRSALDMVPAHIYIKDTHSRYLYANQSTLELFGVSSQELVGSEDSKFFPPETVNHLHTLDSRVFQGTQTNEEIESRDSHGNRQVYSEIKTPILSETGKEIAGLVGISTNITERKQAEEEKEKLESQLRQAQKMEAVGRLAGGVAHDFNNMLGVILGHAEMALERIKPNQPFHADLTEIKKAAERSADLTRQLLAFARKQTVAPQVVDLNNAVAGMTQMLQRLIGEDIEMAWIPGKKVWPVKIDPSQIDQILANLCVNAQDAIADVGKVTIETNNAVFDEATCADHLGFMPGEYVMLAVSDDGCGMDTETLKNIFEPFYTTKEVGKGTGLGLATVYGAVKQNSGFIKVVSEPDQGTTFKIYLPRHWAQAAPVPDKRPDAPAGGHETILLVEDEPAILRMTTMMLELEGYTVLEADTPGKAIELAQTYSGEIDLLMTDVVMPEMNGRALAKNLLSQYPKLKRLFISGYTADVIAHHGVLDKGVNFIQKPFSKPKLMMKVREALNSE
jgi:PAS domain S-box-containing protein